MRAMLVLCLLPLTGCAGFQPWVAANQTQIVAVGIVAGTVSSVESATLNTVALAEKLGGDGGKGR